MPAITKLLSGPTIAIRNSVRGSFDSPVRFETPPNRNSVIEWTAMPRRIATSEWASSCTSTDVNSRIADTAPISHASTGWMPGRNSGSTPVAIDQVVSPKMINQLTCTPMSMPAMRNNRTELRIMTGWYGSFEAGSTLRAYDLASDGISGLLRDAGRPQDRDRERDPHRLPQARPEAP